MGSPIAAAPPARASPRTQRPNDFVMAILLIDWESMGYNPGTAPRRGQRLRETGREGYITFAKYTRQTDFGGRLCQQLDVAREGLFTLPQALSSYSAHKSLFTWGGGWQRGTLPSAPLL